MHNMEMAAHIHPKETDMASRLTLPAILSIVDQGYDGLALLEKYGYVDGKDHQGVDWTASNENLSDSDLDVWATINSRIGS